MAISKTLSVLEPAAGGAACCTPLTEAPLTEDQARELAVVFKALADPVRLRLLSRIATAAGGEACVCDLTAGFELTGPTISHHLRVLREAGLIDCERRRTWVYYRVNPDRVCALAAVLSPTPAARPVAASQETTS